jgi:hypothetical protein
MSAHCHLSEPYLQSSAAVVAVVYAAAVAIVVPQVMPAVFQAESLKAKRAIV